MRTVRTVAAVVGIAWGLWALPAAAQTCPPNDPLCTKDSPGKSKPKMKSDDAEAPPAPAAAAPPPTKAASDAPARGVITLAEVTITGRIQKPIAAVDVGRIAPRLTLSELRQPFLDRIEKAIYSDPF